jgi:AcrR family transcriptional regulator
MARVDSVAEQTARPQRVDARRNEQALLDAAASVFVTSGVNAPVREIAAKAGIGMGTIYRHFPTRPELVVAVYRHQVEACAEAGPALQATSSSPQVALELWVDLFVDFLVTKHGMAGALRHDDTGPDALHTYFVNRLVPVCDALLEAAIPQQRDGHRISAYALMRGVGNLCIGDEDDPLYDARSVVKLFIAGVLATSQGHHQ